MFLLRLLKKFVNAEASMKALILALISLAVVLSFFALDYFWQIRPEALSIKIIREAFMLLLGLSAIFIFFIGIKAAWKGRDEWNDRYGDFRIVTLISGISGVIGCWNLAYVIIHAAKVLFDVESPSTVLTYALIPGAFFLILSIGSYLWVNIRRFCKKIWWALKDAWDRA